jgi:hypothetical protein
MKHFLFTTRLPDGREVCVAPVSSDAFQANGAQSLGDDSGYFIYEYDERQAGTGIEILGKAASYDAAMRIIDIFLSVRHDAAVQPTRLSESRKRVRLPESHRDSPLVAV